MSEVTLELVHAKQTELADLIKKLQQQATTAIVSLWAVEIELRPGERYAGAALDDDGRVTHHVVLMSQRPDKRLGWKAAMAWAKDVGGDLPTRQEQSLLFANCKPHVKADWHWSNEEYADDNAYAWSCNFTNGHQHYDHQSYEGCAVAVRMIPLIP